MSAPTTHNRSELESVARRLRRHIITSTTAAGSGHPTSSLSAVEVVTALYFGGILRYNPRAPQDPRRDRFIMSKGHAAPLLYAALAEAGFFPVSDLATLRKLGSALEGHPNLRRLPGVEASTGSLGQGLSIGLGHALAARLDGHDARVFVLLGDGEINEGQVWEAVMAAGKYRAGNLIAIVDRNGYQQTGAANDVLDLEPLVPKWEAFGWQAADISGHDLEAVGTALRRACEGGDRPNVIIARTEKGYPITGLLSEKNYHGKPLSAADAERALSVIGA
ncbi:MAG TPA: transketolase [Gemmatales bacterium]|nr:transketolase [Gemmatales bacterium]HMP58355.1 transketolase [Gemmatales bacterium]